MGYAARANTTVRDGQRPARLAPATRYVSEALTVFAPTKSPVVKPDGTPVLGPNNKPLVRYGFRPNATAGEQLTDEHYFDGRAIRRFGKVNGKVAKQARAAARRAALGMNGAGQEIP